jgi:hypothetical protein
LRYKRLIFSDIRGIYSTTLEAGNLSAFINLRLSAPIMVLESGNLTSKKIQGQSQKLAGKSARST